MQYSRLSETVKIKKISEDANRGVFEIDGLYAGYGLTIGNALRRALLSSLPGAAITRVKIKGIKHEFSTLDGIMEDIVEISLNLKKVRFKFFSDEPQVLTLDVKGEKEVSAADIKSNAQAEIVNPDQHIATLTDKKAELSMEITVEKGLGYAPADARKSEKLPIGVIALDALFTPVVNVNFTIENMRVGERTDYNKVIFEVQTDGTISPSAALHKSGNILKDHFDRVSQVEVVEASVEEEPAKEKKSKKK